MSAAAISTSGCRVESVSSADLDDLDPEVRPGVDEQPPRVAGEVVAEQQRPPRHLARGPPGDQPLGVDRLSEPDDPQVGVERLEPGPEPFAHHHDRVDDTGHQGRQLRVERALWLTKTWGTPG